LALISPITARKGIQAGNSLTRPANQVSKESTATVARLGGMLNFYYRQAA
jgi:hypothetical protein